MARQASVADKHDSIDVATLKELERLLTSTELATATDLVGSDGVNQQQTTGTEAPASVDATGSAPLPKRR